MKFTLKEMNGLLNGKCLPSDLIVGETLSEYLIRKFSALEQRLIESERYGRQTDITIDNLELKLAQMAAENAGLKESRQRLAEFIHEELDADYPLNMDIETPETDAFMAKVRASGVEMFASVLESRGRHQDYVEIANAYAAKIRKGVQS
ncbi:hypothetical protein [Enterobacter ludwigii]|uniref:hypothetical protein n=1 Tax=Enterobacter ludwigii TaxID=299767 RepID=UPI002FD4F1D6